MYADCRRRGVIDEKDTSEDGGLECGVYQDEDAWWWAPVGGCRDPKSIVPVGVAR